MNVEQVIKLISEEPCPWNPLQTPEWHLHQWRTSLIQRLTAEKKKADGKQA